MQSALHEKLLWRDCNPDLFGDFTDENFRLFIEIGNLIEQIHFKTTCWLDHKTEVKKLFTAFTQLRHLDCSGNSDLKDVTFMCDNITLLHVNFHECFNIRRLSLLTSITCLTDLRSLDLSDCDQLKERDIARIAKKLTKLEHFNVRDTKSLHIETVREVCDKLQWLRQFLFCPLIFESDTSDWVEIYMEYPTLQICPAGLEIIIEKNPHLFQ